MLHDFDLYGLVAILLFTELVHLFFYDVTCMYLCVCVCVIKNKENIRCHHIGILLHNGAFKAAGRKPGLPLMTLRLEKNIRT